MRRARLEGGAVAAFFVGCGVPFFKPHDKHGGQRVAALLGINLGVCKFPACGCRTRRCLQSHRLAVQRLELGGFLRRQTARPCGGRKKASMIILTKMAGMQEQPQKGISMLVPYFPCGGVSLFLSFLD